jgi:peptide/nickel transport system permease protein
MKFFKNTVSLNNLGIVLSSCFVLFCLLISLFSYIFIPDSSRFSNQMHLQINSKPPGFKSSFIIVPNSNSNQQSFLSKLFTGSKYPDTEILISDFQLLKNSINYTDYSNEEILKSIPFSNFPSNLNSDEIIDKFLIKRNYLFGTDNYGRDVFGRVMLGTRVSMSIGIIAVFISLLIGVFIGLISGYYGGLTDQILMMVINIFWSIPTLLLVIAFTLALGKGFWQVYVAVGLTMWVEVARVVRGQVISEKNKDYITATKVLGFSDSRVFFKHLIPNIIGPILIISAANFASAILIESGLSFLGIGSQPPIPSWGSMIKDNYQYIILGKAYLAVIPGIAIMLLVTSFMFLGNNLEEYFKSK